MKKLLIIILMLSANICLGQPAFQPDKISKPVLLLTAQLPLYSTTAYPTYQHSKYDTVFKAATIDELYELTSHPNPLVRRSAFASMLQKNTPRAFELLDKNASDTVQWFYVQRCNNIRQSTFADEMLYYLTLYSGWSNQFIMTPVQREKAFAMIEKRNADCKGCLNCH